MVHGLRAVGAVQHDPEGVGAEGVRGNIRRGIGLQPAQVAQDRLQLLRLGKPVFGDLRVMGNGHVDPRDHMILPGRMGHASGKQQRKDPQQHLTHKLRASFFSYHAPKEKKYRRKKKSNSDLSGFGSKTPGAAAPGVVDPITARSCLRFWGRGGRRGCLPYRSGT